MTANDFPFEVDLAELDHERSGTLEPGSQPPRRQLAARIDYRPDCFFTVPLTNELRQAIHARNRQGIVAALQRGGSLVDGKVEEDNSGWCFGDDLDSRFEGNPRQLLVLIFRPPRGRIDFPRRTTFELTAKGGPARRPGASARTAEASPSRKCILNDALFQSVADKLVSPGAQSIHAACATAKSP